MRALDDDAMFDFDRKQEAELQEPGLAPVARGRGSSRRPASPTMKPLPARVDIDDWDDEPPATSGAKSPESEAEHEKPRANGGAWDDAVSPSAAAGGSSALQPLEMDEEDEDEPQEHATEDDEAEEEDEEEEDDDDELELSDPVGDGAAKGGGADTSPAATSGAPSGSTSWAMVHAGGIELEGLEFDCASSVSAEAGGEHASGGEGGVVSAAQLRKAVSEAVAQVEERARRQQERAVQSAIEAAAEQLRQELEAQAVELEAEFEARIKSAERKGATAAAAAPSSDAAAGVAGAEQRQRLAQERLERRSREKAEAAVSAGESTANASLTSAHSAALDEVESRQRRCLRTFRGAINGLSSGSLQASVLEAIGQLEEATRLVCKLQSEVQREPFIERISLPSSLLARPPMTEDAGEEEEGEDEHEL